MAYNPAASTYVANVLAWGALGDGSTDDSAAFAAAAVAAETLGVPLFIPNTGHAYVIATGFTVSGQSIECQVGAKISYTGAGTCLTFVSAEGCAIRNLSIASTTGAIGILFNKGTSTCLVDNLQIYPFSNGTCIKFKQTFLYTFIGGLIRNCKTHWIDVDDSQAAGSNYANLCLFSGVTFQQDAGTNPTSGINWLLGNNIKFDRCYFGNSDAANVAIDLGNGSITSGENNVLAFTVTDCQFEGNYTNCVRSGNGTYSTSIQEPGDIRLLRNQVNGTITNVYNLAYTGDFTIQQGQWPQVSGKNYIISSTCDSGIILDGSYNSGNLTQSGTRVLTLTEDGRLITVGDVPFLNVAGQSSGAASGAGTLTNAPASGNPQFWLEVIINNTAYWVPAWHA